MALRPEGIVFHGFAGSKDRSHTVAACEAAREAGFAALRLNLYGHGESGGAEEAVVRKASGTTEDAIRRSKLWF